MTRLARRAGFVVVQLLVVGLVVELGLRLLEPRVEALRVLLYAPQATVEWDDVDTLEELLASTVLGYRPCTELAGFVTNSRGLRTREYRPAGDAGIFRAVVLGDSFAFASGGVPYGLGWPVRIEETLGRRVSRPVEVLSLGVPGVGPRFERRMWQLEGARLEPDLVLLAFFAGNDFSDEQAIGWNARLTRQSLVFRLVRNLTRLGRGGVEVPASPPRPASCAEGGGGYEVEGYRRSFASRRPLLEREALWRVEGLRSWVWDRGTRRSFERAFTEVAAVLRELHREVAAAGAELVVVVIPDRFQVNAAERREIVEGLGRVEADFDLERPQRMLGELLTAEEIPHLDLLPAFREAAAEVELYSPGDTHWSVAGNALAAREIAGFLASRMVVETELSSISRSVSRSRKMPDSAR